MVVRIPLLYSHHLYPSRAVTVHPSVAVITICLVPTMLGVIFCSLLLHVAFSTTFGTGSSAVITNKDVQNGNANMLMLTSGGKYRVYAVYASSAENDNYVKNVVVKGADGVQFTVSDLAKPKGGSGYFLDENKIAMAPLTITDSNAKPQTGFLIRVPFTIYIVSDSSLAPVVSAQLVNGNVDSTLAKMNAVSCTILSAEQSIQISNIDVGSKDSVQVTVAGYDRIYDLSSSGSALVVKSETAVGSSLMVSGPIATLSTLDAHNGNYSFVMKRGGAWTGSLTPGASTAFLSNGWLTMTESYNVDYTNDLVLSRSYDYGRETLVTFSALVGNYFPPEDKVTLLCYRDNDVQIPYDMGSQSGTASDWCRRIVLTVNCRNIVDPPRFRVQIDSGAISASMFTLLMASVIAVFHW